MAAWWALALRRSSGFVRDVPEQMARSSPPVAASVPSALKAAALIGPLCCSGISFSPAFRSSRSKRRTRPVEVAVSRRFFFARPRCRPGANVRVRPGEEEQALDVEQDEHQGIDVILDPEADPGLAIGPHAALVDVALGERPLARRDDPDDDQRGHREGDRHQQQEPDEHVVVHHHNVHHPAYRESRPGRPEGPPCGVTPGRWARGW